jgi:hypothetical protein
MLRMRFPCAANGDNAAAMHIADTIVVRIIVPLRYVRLAWLFASGKQVRCANSQAHTQHTLSHPGNTCVMTITVRRIALDTYTYRA